MHKQAKQPSGVVFYRGTSQLGGAPVVGIAILGKSTNSKTGAMLQTYIIRPDMSPIDAVKTGADVAICGDCRHRGIDGAKRTCYVTLIHGPSAVYRAYLNGSYPDIGTYADSTGAATLGDARSKLAEGRNVRIGTYGDPAAIPEFAWRELLAKATGRTGYTHQWRRPEFAGFRTLVMASVDSESERAAAVSQGWRTFRVKAASEPMAPREVSCPASEEAGKKTDCNTCQACSGADGRKGTIVINAHGTSKRYFALKLITA